MKILFTGGGTGGHVYPLIAIYREIKRMFNMATKMAVLVGHSTHKSDWVNWEIRTFYDRKKVPLTLTLEEYAEIFWECFFLTLAFDIAWFDLRYEIIGIMLEAIKIVDDFFKKQGSRLVPVKEGLSILDWALLIESGKIR